MTTRTVTARDEADRAARDYVRQRDRGVCQGPNCHRAGSDVAHIIGRKANATRCEPDNLVLLCGPCHTWLGDSYTGLTDDRLEFIDSLIGEARYRELLEQSRADSTGLKPVYNDAYWTAVRNDLNTRQLFL